MKEMLGKPSENRDKLDFYATHPIAIKELIERENLKGFNILENSAGNGHLSKELNNYNNVFSIDIKKRNYNLNYVGDFLKLDNYKSISNKKFDFVIYNPPFKHFIDFVKHSFFFADKQWVFGRIQILESKKRYKELFNKGWLKKVYIFSNRIACAKGGDENFFLKSNSMVYCWFLFDYNNKNKPIIEWIVYDKCNIENK